MQDSPRDAQLNQQFTFYRVILGDSCQTINRSTGFSFQWDDNLNTYTFSVRIQNSALIDASDEIYYISCSYGDVDNQMESEFKILDPNFSMESV